MLVLSRKINQTIMIGEDIEVVVLEVKDGVVKLGIDAPKDVKVFRKEVFDDIKNENNKALEADIGIFMKMLDINKGK